MFVYRSLSDRELSHLCKTGDEKAAKELLNRELGGTYPAFPFLDGYEGLKRESKTR